MYKKYFPIFEKHPDLVYLDSAATSLTPKNVADKMYDYYVYNRSTVNRGESKIVSANNQAYEECRNKVATLIGSSPTEVIFGKSTTALMNHLARNIIENLNEGDEILISELEHHSTLLSFREIAKKNKIEVKLIRANNNRITLEAIEKTISQKTKVLVLHHVSNVIGDSVDLNKVAHLCQKNNIISVIDGAQGVLHEPLKLNEWGIDFYVFSAHKIFGPTGLGIMHGNKEIIKDYIFEYGGDMASTVDEEQLIPKPLPHRLEAGTPCIAQVLGFSQSVDFINEIGIEQIHNYSCQLRQACIAELKKLPEVKIYNEDTKTSLIVFNINGVAAHDALAVYAKENVSIRGGQMCNALSLNYLNENSVLRASFNIYNTPEDIAKFVSVTKEIIADPLAWM